MDISARFALRLAPCGLKPVHDTGSVDVFLEVFGKSRKGDVLVIDNQDRRDEGCIGDLTALEAWTAGIAGIIVGVAMTSPLGMLFSSAFADEDGAIFIDAVRVEEVLAKAESIANVERRQAALIREGKSLRAQLRFDEYLARRNSDPSWTLRRHLEAIGASVEV